MEFNAYLKIYTGFEIRLLFENSSLFLSFVQHYVNPYINRNEDNDRIIRWLIRSYLFCRDNLLLLLLLLLFV